MPPPQCATCGRRHIGRCRRGVCYTCGDPTHYARDCPQGVGHTVLGNSVAASSPSVRAPETGPQASSGRGRGGGRAPNSSTGPHRIYALGGRLDPEARQDTPPGMNEKGMMNQVREHVPSQTVQRFRGRRIRWMKQ
ncbi:uncharacterized protein LOC132041450, partial [Lycium ferocissimum]|uniref:uncharacterized protein LOC132041450 n=1 Tax=Lycium ferocissimum TaxID=112874 RepID=UPI0028163C1C